MRLLTEYMPLPEINDAVIKDTVVVNDKDIEPLFARTEPEIGENRNLQLAKQIDDFKTALITNLSNFPITALWLLSKYNEHSTIEQNDELNSPSEIGILLSEISNKYQLLGLTRQGGDGKNINSAEAIIQLSDSLAKFPYAFEDLVKLVDVVLYTYHTQVPLEETHNTNSKYADIVKKRLNAAINRGDSSRANKFKRFDWCQQETELLSLSTVELGELIQEIVLAEHEWLDYRKQLAAANAKLVLFIANQYKGSFLDFDDMVQEGHTGLLKAIDRFKYRLGFQFSTYAGYWIRQAISRALSRSERVVRIPCGQVAAINKLYRSKDELMLKTGVEPSIKELSDYCQLSPEEINQLLSISQMSVALESFDDGEEEQAFAPIDFLEQQIFNPSFNMIADSQLEKLLRNAVNGLNPREAKIISAHFGMDTGQQQTLQDIGNELDLTRERVRQIQAAALNKIKMRYGEQLVSFMG